MKELAAAILTVAVSVTALAWGSYEMAIPVPYKVGGELLYGKPRCVTVWAQKVIDHAVYPTQR